MSDSLGNRRGNRVALWDNLKFILILLVVIGHFVDQYEADAFKSIYLFIYGFHMPMFFFISGLFHKNERISQKVCVYLAIYALYRCLLLIIAAAFGKSTSFNLFASAATPWFMFAMAVFVGLTYLIRNVNKWFMLGFSVFLACLAGFDTNIGDMFFLSRIFVFFPFYFLGTIIPRQKLEELHRRPAFRIGGILVILAWLVACFLFLRFLYYLRPLLTGRNPYGSAIRPIGAFLRFGCYLLACVTGFALIMATPSQRFGFLSDCGRKTLQIYFWHRPILYVLTFLGLNQQICDLHHGLTFWLLIAIALTFLLSLPIFGFPTDQIMRFQRTESKE